MKHRGRLRGVGTLRGCGVAARFASASVHLCGKLKITLIGKKGGCRGVHICGEWKLDSHQFRLYYLKKINFSKNTHFPHWHHWHIDNNCKFLIISIVKGNIYVNGCQWCQWCQWEKSALSQNNIFFTKILFYICGSKCSIYCTQIQNITIRGKDS